MQATIDPILRILAPDKPRHEVYDLDIIYHAVLHTYNGRSTLSTQDNRMITAPVSAEETQHDVSITNSPVPAATSAAQSPMNTSPMESASTTADMATAKQTCSLGSRPAVNSQYLGTTQPTTTTRLSAIPEPREQLEAIPIVNVCATQDERLPRPVPFDSDYEAVTESCYELDTDNLPPPAPAPEPPDSEDKSNDDETAIPAPHKLDGTLSLPRTIPAPHTTTAVARRNEALEIRHEVYRRRHREGIGTPLQELNTRIANGYQRRRSQYSSLRLVQDRRIRAIQHIRRRQTLRKRRPPERAQLAHEHDRCKS